jgi:hypothetical protein
LHQQTLKNSKLGNVAEELALARARIRLLEELGSGAKVLSETISSSLTADQQRLAKLVLDAAFFVAVRHVDGFIEFLAEKESVNKQRTRKRRSTPAR